MNKLLKPAAFLFLISTISCSKPANNTNSNNNTDPNNNNNNGDNAMTYALNGLSEVKIDANGNTAMPLEIKLSSGTQEQVTLSVKDMPAGVTASFSSGTGTPTFTTTLNIDASNATVGNFTPSVVITPATATAKSFPFNLNISAAVDCRNALTGSYMGNSGCSNTEYFALTPDPDNADRIFLQGLWGKAIPNDKIYAIINCNDKTLTIPQQPANFGAQQMSGSGTFEDGKVNLTYSSYWGGGPTCTGTFFKQ